MVPSVVARVISPNAGVIGMLHLLMLAMSPLVPVPDIAAPIGAGAVQTSKRVYKVVIGL